MSYDRVQRYKLIAYEYMQYLKKAPDGDALVRQIADRIADGLPAFNIDPLAMTTNAARYVISVDGKAVLRVLVRGADMDADAVTFTPIEASAITQEGSR